MKIIARIEDFFHLGNLSFSKDTQMSLFKESYPVILGISDAIIVRENGKCVKLIDV